MIMILANLEKRTENGFFANIEKQTMILVKIVKQTIIIVNIEKVLQLILANIKKRRI